MDGSSSWVRNLTKKAALSIPSVRHLYDHSHAAGHELTTAWAALERLSREKEKMAEDLTTAWAALERLSQEKATIADELATAEAKLAEAVQQVVSAQYAERQAVYRRRQMQTQVRALRDDLQQADMERAAGDAAGCLAGDLVQPESVASQVSGVGCNAETAMPNDWIHQSFSVADCFKVPLVDMGSFDPKYAGVLTPEAEIGRPKIGVSDILLSGAETYFSKFENFGYIYSLLKTAIDRMDRPLGGLVLDFGSGFGNTVIPILAEHPNVRVLAMDISPDLLAICARESTKRGLGDRCRVVAMNVEQDYLKHGIADAVFGGAILHHMNNPRGVVQTAINVLKPGGSAVFLEPFESGHSELRVAYSQILEEAERRGETGPAFIQLRCINQDIEVRTHRDDPNPPDFTWGHLDDKWLFTKSYFENMAERVGASNVRLERIHPVENMFSNHTTTVLNYGGLTRSDLPKWGWDIIQRFDEDFYSSDRKRELYIEAMVIFSK